MGNLRANRKRWKKSLRYLRWISKAVFLLLFIVPVAYLPAGEWPAGAGEQQVPMVPITSFFFPDAQSNFLLPVTQSPCSVFLNGYCNISPGAWLLCPLGGLQALIPGRVAAFRLLPTIVAILFFVALIVLLGNVFCSWICPVGTVVDSFDKTIEKFFPKLDAKRNKRSKQSVQRARARHNEVASRFLCPLCPLSKIISTRKDVLANGILASVLFGSFALRFNIFCAICPIGILSKGFMHLKANLYVLFGYITTRINFVILIEMWVFPIVAVLVSIIERRFWCNRLCPVGALLNGVGALNPFIKPKIEQKKCIMRGCPDECDDYHLDYCGFCRLYDDRKCEKVCPVGINLVDDESLHKCTKCMECYIACDYNAIKVKLVGKPEVCRIGGFFKRLRARWQKD